MQQSNNQLATVGGIVSADAVNNQSASIEHLRQILMVEQHREVVYDEALSIGESLIEFFQVLSSDAI